jgi:FkbH-like protein
VRWLFSTRKDFPLRWEHFSAAAISWQAKAGGIRQVANKLRIGLDAILFVDDNPGELAAVAAELPTVSTLHAATDATLTHRALEFYPGLWAWERTPTDAIRAADLEAETERARLASDVADPMDYLRSLQVKLRIGITPRAHLARLHELSQKTNQFNLNLERLSEVELATLLDAPDHRVAVIGLQDRLSDSGLIGLLIGRLEGDVLCIRELAISCRALGRRLEDLMIAEAVRAVRAELPATRVQFCHRIGPRNAPARDWLARWVGQGLASEGRVEAHHSLSRVSPADYPVAVEVIHHESKRD